jgi:hypothetical protein
VRRPFEVITRDGDSTPPKPGAEQQKIDIDSEFVLQLKTLPSDAPLSVDSERKPPKLVLVLSIADLIARVLRGGHE